MGRRALSTLWAAALSAAATMGGAAFAANYAVPVDIPAEPLAEALQQLGRQSGVDLLYDADVTAGLRTPAVRGRLTPEATLQRLLAGTTLVARRTPSGVLVVERRAAPPLARQDATVPEILVVGRRSQNADIRRLESDIQPYRVASVGQVLQADRDNLDQYFRSRVTSNTEAVPPSLDARGETNSEIDLRGLGPTSTLALVDGRRMPSIPAEIFGFRQPDINPVPLHALDRVEVLTGTAGGIYGFGALGGVVNVVLARPEHGAEVDVTGGIASRGDAAQYGLEGRVAFSPDGGKTDVSLFIADGRSDPLLSGERDFVARDQQQSAAASLRNLVPLRPNGNSVFVGEVDTTAALRLKPQYGGATLSSTFTFLPGGLSGAPAEVAAALARNAGKIDDSQSAGGADTAIGSNPRTSALLANVRHRFDGGVEAYLDAVVLHDEGRFVRHGLNTGGFLSADSPANPFTQSVEVSFPVPGAGFERRAKIDSARYSAGVLAPLPFDWRATAEVALGEAHYKAYQALVSYSPPFTAPDATPFGNWAAFQAATNAFLLTNTNAENITNHFSDFSLRLAGPVFRTPGGPATLTLSAERRVEDVPAYANTSLNGGVFSSKQVAARGNATNSFYVELRSRVFGETAPSPLLRDLEVQAAIRNDNETDDFSPTPTTANAPRRRVTFSGTAYTVGAKVSPAPWLTLRASYATGATPPALSDLIETLGTRSQNAGARDPKRGNQLVSNYPAFDYHTGGSPDLETAEASTASFGAILTPLGADGPRLTVDYSRIRKRRDVFRPSDQFILDHEAILPDRVTRAPLTDADRAKGFTGGLITMLDSRAQSTGGLNVETIDAHLEWPLAWLGGLLRVYGDATYYLENEQTAPFTAPVERVGFLNSPLQRRANLGATWTRGPVTLGANVQYFGGYRIFPPGSGSNDIDFGTAIQGSQQVSSQAYLDLHAAWRHRLAAGARAPEVAVELGIVNVLDTAPPRENRFSTVSFVLPPLPVNLPGYSRYGDPRQRRFVLRLGATF